MTERQIRLALKRALATFPTDAEIDMLTNQIKASGLVDQDDEAAAVSTLAGFVIGYDAGRADGKTQAQSIPYENFEAWKRGDWRHSTRTLAEVDAAGAEEYVRA